MDKRPPEDQAKQTGENTSEHDDLARMRDIQSLVPNIEPLLGAHRAILQLAEPMLLARRLLLPQLEAQRTIASLAPAFDHLAATQSFMASLPALNFENLRLPILDVQMFASTAAWTATIARLNAVALDFAAMRPAIVGLSEVLASRLEAVRHAGLWLDSLRISPAVLGIRSRDLRAGLLQPIASHLRAVQATQFEPRASAPVSFALLTASGIAGASNPQPPSPATEAEAQLTLQSEEVRASGIELLGRRYPNLTRKLDGARQAIRSGNVDGVSQASHSLQEFTDQTLRRLTDTAAALDWCRRQYPKGIYRRAEEDALTRAGKVRYIAHTGGFDGTIGDDIATIVTAASQILQKGKHDAVPIAMVESLLLVVEGYIGAIMALMGDQFPNG
jgi:hypothetical protein